MTIIGTRPEIIRLSLVIPKLDMLCEHVLVHTGQNYDPELNDIFMEELNIREPDYQMATQGSPGEQMGVLMEELEDIIGFEEPDAFLVLGDTNSSLGAIMAKRMGIQVFHVEAGNRCHDPKSPEEINRKIIDHVSDIHMPYTELSRQNLLREGIAPEKIFVVGNPIKEVIDTFTYPEASRKSNYFLVTLHRQENVDNERLDKFVEILNNLDREIIWPMHPRTKKMLKGKLKNHITVLPPQGFKSFIDFERQAYCVLTDSGTVQEECAIFGVPCVTLRDSTERPETLESGSNIVSGIDGVERAIRVATELRPSSAPEEYFVQDVSSIIVKIVLGYHAVR